MTTRAAQVPMLEHVAPSMLSIGRRSLPPAVIRPGQRPVSQQWRERPRYPGPRVAPGSDDGVVHAIAGRVRCRGPRSQFVRDKRAARVAVSVAASFRTSTVRARAPICPRTGPVPSEPTRRGLRRAVRTRTITPLMVAPCSASSMLFAPLRPGRRPGLRALTTPARGASRALARWPGCLGLDRARKPG